MLARDRVSVFALWERQKSGSKADVAWEKENFEKIQVLVEVGENPAEDRGRRVLII